jgi:L-ascorbate metabolism protein UlaG (beta-lactamase superfamily)
MAFIGDCYRPDLALLPIGGHFTMDPVHAGYAVRTYFKKVKKVVPMHYGTFGLPKGAPEEFKKALSDFSRELVVMQPGDTRSF